MTTTLMPLDPAMTPQRSTRILTIAANLLPAEIVAARRARRTRGWVIVVVAVVAVLCAAWFAWRCSRSSAADEELAAATTDGGRTCSATSGSSPRPLEVQADTEAAQRQLAAVMANDLDWAALLATLRNAGAPSRHHRSTASTAS